MTIKDILEKKTTLVDDIWVYYFFEVLNWIMFGTAISKALTKVAPEGVTGTLVHSEKPASLYQMV